MCTIGVVFSKTAHALGDDGAFHPRLLVTGPTPDLAQQTHKTEVALRASAPSRWSSELVRRTSAPARLAPDAVRADSPQLWREPFVVWIGAEAVDELTHREVQGLRTFFALGGVMLVDDSDPESGLFSASVKRQLQQVLPDTRPTPIGTEHVIFRSFYLLDRATGAVAGATGSAGSANRDSGKQSPNAQKQADGQLQAIVRGGQTQVIFSSYDLLGALAQDRNGLPLIPAVPGGEQQREMATRLAVNIAMFVLCTNYKDDQVHAPFLMRRRMRNR